MKSDGKFIARVALFSALAYVAALASIYVPNVSLIFVVVFVSGILFGLRGGVTVGGIGMFLWSLFNPFGMTSLPIIIAQITGMVLVGAQGAILHRSTVFEKQVGRGYFLFALLGLSSGLIFQVILNLVYAWIYRPFWESLYAGMLFSLLTIVSNTIIFPLCYPLVIKLCKRERVW